MQTKDGDRRNVLTCSHVVSKIFPILYAERDDPIEDADSGWRCFCNPVNADHEKDARLCSVDELIELERSLAPFIDMPIGTRLFRKNTTETWAPYVE